MGRGLVEPIDDFRVTNPPTNEALLQALADDFVKNGYSIKKLERAYSELPRVPAFFGPEPNECQGPGELLAFLVRRLMSEQIADSMVQVTGIPQKYPSMPIGTRAMTIPVLPYLKPDYMMKVFGRTELREVICERDTKASVAQVMHLVSGDTIQKQITAKDGNLDAWLADPKLTDNDVAERIYLAALTRQSFRGRTIRCVSSSSLEGCRSGKSAQGI